MRPHLTQKRLKELLVYDKASLLFRWKTSGKVAGAVDSNGHRVIRIDYQLYQATHLVVLWFTGQFPVGRVSFRGGVYSLRYEDLIFKKAKETNLEEQKQAELNRAKAGMKNGELTISEKDLDRLLRLFSL